MNIFGQPTHEVTKRFVQNLDGMDIADIKEELKSLYPSGKLIRLYFSADISQKPILAEIMRKSDLPISIVNSRILHSQAGPTGSMYVHLADGDPSDFINYMRDEGVKVEVLSWLIGIKCLVL